MNNPLTLNDMLMSNPQLNHSTLQLRLPLDVSTMIRFDDPVTSLLDVMKGVNLNKYLRNPNQGIGRNGYDPKAMLRIVLFAYTINVRSTRKIEELCRNDIRFMYLSDEITPSHMSICNFINNYLLNNIEDISNDIIKYLIEQNKTDILKIFIDGTKVEGRPNKYTWVWKKACITNRDKKFNELTGIFNSINEEYKYEANMFIETKETYTIEEVESVVDLLKKKAEEEGIIFTSVKRSKKAKLQKTHDEIVKILNKLKEYAEKIEICGEHRNSYSKTDHDATFMRTKTDYMGNTALLPAYNIQYSNAGEFILYALTSQFCSDNKCFIPLMEKYKAIFGHYPEKAVGDAGYGTLETYEFCEKNNIGKFMKFASWKRETHDKKYHNDPFRMINFKIDEEGNPVCPNGKRFFKIGEKVIRGNADKRTEEIYQCEDCKGCPFRNKCNKYDENRKINVNRALTTYHQEVIDNLASEEGIKLRMTRSYMAEGAFGVVKEDYNYKRITRTTLKKVNLEVYLVIIGFNIKKHHNLKFRKDNKKTVN